MPFSTWMKTLGVPAALSAMIVLQPAQSSLAQDSTQQATAPQAAATQPELLSAEELETLVARIALYPDDLVALVLAGSLYPLQIVQAQRYLDDVKSKPNLKPNADWDGSVISLLNYPQVIKMMNDDLNWTEEIGQAVVNQQKDMLVAIQELRDRAVANNIIKSDDKVVVEKQKDNVIIKPAKKEVTYVPQYDPVILSPTYVVEASAPPVYYGDPYPSYYYPYAPYWAGFVTGAVFGAVVDWDDWHSWGGDDIDIDINDIDINNFKWDKNNINNINWDNDKFNFDRDSIADNLRRNNSARLDRKPNRERGGLSNLGGQGNKITGRDVRRDVQQGLKNKGREGGKNLSGQTLGDRGKVADRKAGQNLGGQTRKAGQNLGGQVNKPARNKAASANRPARKPAGKVDKRPRQVSGLGDYGRGRETKSFSQRGRMSSGGGLGGGGQRIKRSRGGGFGGGGRGGGRRR
ncbi:DUF3300 domain-containing protein [Taklimakanibacter deserti]|uniref:DUF3300 domain-containing protein n=1 Tax=Taklimakanibacter deserti TaxID=2267839 RepID=UPI0034D6CE86